MGYYTFHTLTVWTKDKQLLDDVFLEQHKKEIVLNSEYKNWYDEDSWESFWFDEQTWYQSEVDMKAHSLKYPDLIFELYSVGEASEDNLETDYFHNGEVQSCSPVITWPECKFFKNEKVKTG